MNRVSSALVRLQQETEAQAATIAALRAEVEQLRVDAERYRWLRDKSVPPHNFYLSVPIEFADVRYQTQDVDAYIDAARKEADRG